MSIYKVASCDVCNKTKPLDDARESFFMVNISHVFCSEECYEKVEEIK